MIQLHSEVSCIFENLHMKSTSWIGTDGKESLAPNCAAYGGSFLTAYTYIYSAPPLNKVNNPICKMK